MTHTDSKKRDWITFLKDGVIVFYSHVVKHTGMGIVCAVAYFDPGNWGVDLQAGSEYGYKLLFVVLLAGLFAVFLQVLASRLGCVTGLDLASHCRILLYSRPKHTLWYRYLCHYPLYVLSEVAIIATDLAELLGSAIALCMLFPKLELWHGVLITAFDVVFLLAMRDPLRGTPVRTFELLIAALVLVVLICICIIIAKVDVDWGKAFFGFVPSKAVVQSGGLYTSVGILGATVMPHSLFLGSALATQNRESFDSPSDETLPTMVEPKTPTPSSRSYFGVVIAYIVASFRAPPAMHDSAKSYDEHINHSLDFVQRHIYHGTIDIAASLLGFAVVINSLILILAGSVFFYGSSNGEGSAGPASLFDAYDLIRDLVGQGPATVFAIALLAAGQSSSIIATVAGQAVSEGFLQWRISAVLRRLLTRMIAIVPSMVVAIAMGRQGINVLLVASQVILSVVLPFIMLPLIYLTSSKVVMGVKANEDDGEAVNFSNHWTVMALAMMIWLVVVIANVYVLVSLGLGIS